MNTARLAATNRFAYGILGLPLAALGLPLVVYLPPYYAGLPGLTAGLVGGVLFAARVIDVLTDPLVGWLSDRCPTRLGRRLPWILAGTPLLLVSAWLLFAPLPGAGPLYLFVWSAAAYLGWTLIYLPYTTLGAELSTDYDERSRITAFREGFFVLGTVVAIVLPPLIERGTGFSGLAGLAVFLSVSLPLCLLWFFARVREPARTRQARIDWRAGLKLLAGNAPFRRLITAYLLNGMANGFPAALFLFFVQQVLGGDRAAAGGFLLLYFLCAVAGLPLWLRLGRHWSKHRLWCAAMLWAAAVFAWTPLLGSGDYLAYGAICVLAGLSLGVDQAVPASIQADVIDEDTAAGGGDRAGLYFGLWGMATKLAFALAVGIAYPLLELAGFVAGAQDNTGSALLVLALLYAGVPVIVKLGVVGMMWRFPLDRSRHAELRARIEELR